MPKGGEQKKVEAYGISDKGKQRNINQDTIYYSTEPVGILQNLFIVADGMGGHASGDFASRYTVEQLVSLLSKTKNGSLISQIDSNIRLVNNMLVRYAAENLDMYGMGTTLVMATFEENTAYVANIGDSRLYLVGETIRQITRDHSYVEELVSNGQIKRGSEEYNRQKNVITRAVGNPAGVTADYFEIDIREGDIILMCSDGLSNMISDEEMLYIIQNGYDLKETVKTLVDRANEEGGTDNISCLLIKPL